MICCAVGRIMVKLMPPRLYSTAIQREDLFLRLDDCLTKKLIG